MINQTRNKKKQPVFRTGPPNRVHLKSRPRSSALSIIKPWVVLLLLTGLLVSCVTAQAPQKSNLTPGVVKTQIKKGITSQAEIVGLIGAPNIVAKNKAGEEVWTYSRQSFDSKSGGFGGGLILFGGSQAFSSASANSFDLIITFNSQNIVKDYSVVSSQF